LLAKSKSVAQDADAEPYREPEEESAP